MCRVAVRDTTKKYQERAVESTPAVDATGIDLEAILGSMGNDQAQLEAGTSRE